MLRAWSEKLRRHRGRDTNRSRPVARKRYSLRPGAECLETRELLSISVPGFTLDNNYNLYHGTGKQQVQVDTGVEKFAVVKTRVIDLHGNGSLVSLNGDGSGKV